jgi:hypothetical protein
MSGFKKYSGLENMEFNGELIHIEKVPFQKSEFKPFRIEYSTFLQCVWNACHAFLPNDLPFLGKVRKLYPDQAYVAISVLQSVGISIGIVNGDFVTKSVSGHPIFCVEYNDYDAFAYYPIQYKGESLQGFNNGSVIYWPLKDNIEDRLPSEEPLITLGNFQGKVITAPVFIAQSVSTQDIDFPPFEVTATALIQDIKFPDTEFYLTDSGGSGDCLIKAFNFSLSEYYPELIRYSSASWYRLFNIPINTYLEYEQVLLLSSYYSLNIVIARTFNSEIWFQSFGNPDFERFLYFFNDYNVHYYSWFNFTPAVSGESSGDEDDEVEIHVDSEGVRALPPSASANVLYAFLLESNKFKYKNVNIVLTTYNNVHLAFYNLLKNVNSDGKYLPGYFMKMYYKFRHNTFAFLIKKAIDVEEMEFGTDMSLRKWIDSDKTPDCIFEDEKKIVLLEFTVGNDYERVEFLKGGGSTTLKYTHEASKISEKTGKRCYPLIIPAVLKERNIDEIKNILEQHFLKHQIENEELKYFFEIALDNFSYFGENASVSMTENNVVYHPLDFPALDKHDRPAIKKVLSLSSEFVCSFFDNLERLLVDCHKEEDKRFQAKCSLYYEIDSHRFSVKYDKYSHMVASELRSLLIRRSLSDILPILRINRKGRPLSLEALKGTMPVMCNYEEKVHHKTNLQYENTIPEYFEATHSTYDDGYGAPLSFNQKDLISVASWGPVAFGPNYYSQLLEVSHEDLAVSDKKKKLLASNEMTGLQLVEAVDEFNKAQSEANNIDYLYNPKQTFQFPLLSVPCERVGLNDINDNMLGKYISLSSCGYTKAIMQKALLKQFSEITSTIIAEESRELRNKLSKANSEYYQFASTNFGNKRYKDLDKSEKQTIEPLKKELDSARSLYKASLSKAGSSTRERMVKLKLPKSSSLYSEWKNEMSHFQKTGSQFKGVGKFDDEVALKAGDYFKELSDRMFDKNFQGMDTGPLYDNVRGPGPDFLSKEKDKYTDRWDQFSEMLKGTLYNQMSYFVTELCKSLFKESTRSYNNEYVKIENLGMSNVILLIRGGSKIYKHQTSKLFKVIFLTDHRDHIFSGYRDNVSFETFVTESGVLTATPWMQLHQDTMLDGITFKHRSFMSLYTNHTRAGYSLSETVSRFNFLPVMLFLHNRRKTETFMHNCRYIIVNTLGKYANLKAIIKSFAGFNYTFFDGWLKSCISNNYLQFSERLMHLRTLRKTGAESAIKISELEDLWFKEPISNAEQLTSFIYSTYMMTKAPVNSGVEQSNNLWEILEDVALFEETHPDVDHMNDISLRFSVLDSDCSVYDDDFKYDPVFSQYLGYYTAGFLSKAMGVSRIRQVWIGIKNSSIDSIANSKGLRGWKSSNFFNKKSYEIVYEKVEEMLTSDNIDIKNLVKEYLSEDPLSSTYSVIADKKSFSNQEKTLNDLVFHVVQKIQRGGGREIFCMDYNTKTRQNPLEKFFKELCKCMPNEFISISSNKRAGLIHTDFFERGPGAWVKSIIRWVLDCRRWAPHSVFQKYVHFIHGMAPILPPDFLEEFNSFALKMMNKRFYTREHVLSRMRNNEKFKKYSHFFKKDPPEVSKDGYYFHVKFSFVMGIFNYLSSLMHAGNQLLASELIRDYCLINKLGLVHLEPKCHSDDSVVSSHHEKEESVRPSVILYDWWLKGANHMLSVKKSQVNENVYLEFLSVLYLFDRLLPVIPKFAASIPFQPSDSGYAADVSFAVTQTIELLSQGGTFEEAFLLMKLTEKMIQGLYNLDPVEDVPFNLLGRIDCHPIELLLSGSDCEMYKYIKYRPERTKGIIRVLQESNIIDENDTGTLTLKWDMGSRLNPQLKKKFSKIIEKSTELTLGKWALENTKLGNQYLNLVWFANKLSDPKYYASLIHEPPARRFARIFGAASHRNITKMTGELLPVKDYLNVIKAMGEYPEEVEDNELPFYKTIDVLNEELGDFLEAVSDVEQIEELPNNLKDKPITIVAKDPYIGQSKISPADFVIYIKEREMIPLLGKIRDFTREAKKISDRLITLGVDIDSSHPDDLFKLSSKILGKDNKTYKMVSCTTSSNRYITQYSHLIHLMETNSIRHLKFRYKYKKANVIDWGRKLMKGRIPANVSTAMKHFWAQKCIEKYDVDGYDIFKNKPSDMYKQSMTSVPREWASIIASTEREVCMPLISRYYWSYWPKEQVKINRIWYGKGSCIVNIPETMLKLEILNGMVTEVNFNSQSTAIFSVPSSWYIKTLVSQEGVNMEMVLPDYGDVSDRYLGYVEQTGLYGIGPPHMFSNIFLNTNFSELISEEFMHVDTTPSLERGHWIYNVDNKLFKVYFFTPEDDNIVVSLSEYVDINKIKPLLKDSKVKKFCTDFALQYGFSYSYKLDSLIDNISRSKLYKIVHEAPSFRSTADDKSCKEDDSFIESLVNWRKNHIEFGFPSIDELTELLKSEDIPPLPLAVQQLLYKIGKYDMPDNMRQDILYKVFSLEGEEKEKYIQSISIQYGGEVAVNMISISLKTKRLFNTCKFLSSHALRVMTPIIQCIVSSIESGNVYSGALNRISVELKRNLKFEYRPTEIFKYFASRAIADCMTISDMSSCSKSTGKFLELLSDLLKGGLLKEFAIQSESDSLLRSTDFSIQDQDFLNFVIDVLDSIVFFEWGVGNGPIQNKEFIGETGKLANELNYFRGCLSRIGISPHPRKIHFVAKMKKFRHSYSLPLTTDTEFGVVYKPFEPCTEEGKEELIDGYAFDPDVEDFVETDSSIEVDKFAFIYRPYISARRLYPIRGTAENLLIAVKTVDLNILQTACNFRLFRKNGYSTFVEFININTEYILLLTKSKKTNVTIQGYKEMNYQDFMRFLAPTAFQNDELVVEGVKTTKTELASNYALRSKLDTIESYFGSLSEASRMETLNKVAKASQVADDAKLKLSPEIEALRAQITEAVMKFKGIKPGKEEEKEGKKGKIVTAENEENPVFNLEESLGKIDLTKIENFLDQGDLKNVDRDTVSKRIMRQSPRKIRFDNPIEVLTDVNVRAELETLFPGYLDKLLSKEIFLTQKTKTKRIRMAELCIKTMPKYMKAKYQRLLIICKFVLRTIPEVSDTRREDLRFASIMEDLFMLDEESSDEELLPIYTLIPDTDEVEMELDLSKIF